MQTKHPPFWANSQTGEQNDHIQTGGRDRAIASGEDGRRRGAGGAVLLKKRIRGAA